MARRKIASICSVARGEALGRREFKLGKMAVPALSDAWSRGWHRANAAAPVPGLGRVRRRRRRR